MCLAAWQVAGKDQLCPAGRGLVALPGDHLPTRRPPAARSQPVNSSPSVPTCPHTALPRECQEAPQKATPDVEWAEVKGRGRRSQGKECRRREQPVLHYYSHPHLF